MQIEQPPRILQVPCAHLRVDIAIGLVFVITVGIGAWQFDAPVSKLVSALDAILQVLRRSVSIAQGKADAWRSKEPIMKGIMINHKLIYWCREVDYSGWVGRETKQLSPCNLYTQNIEIGMSQRTLCSKKSKKTLCLSLKQLDLSKGPKPVLFQACFNLDLFVVLRPGVLHARKSLPDVIGVSQVFKPLRSLPNLIYFILSYHILIIF